MSYETIGRIQTITPPQTITTKSGTPYTFAEMCLGVVGYQNRTDTIFFRVTGNAVSALGVLQPGIEVDVKFDIRCRSFQDKDGKTRWATDLSAWDIKPHAMSAPQQFAQPQAPQTPQWGAPQQYAQPQTYQQPQYAQPQGYPQMGGNDAPPF